MLRATRLHTYRAAMLCAATLCVGLPSTALGYTASRSSPIQANGATMTFSFADIPRSATDVQVTVDLYGDYNGTSEFADVTIDGVAPPSSPINPSGTQCNISVTGANNTNRAVFSVGRAVTNDNSLTVVVANSANVSGTTCAASALAGGNRVRVRLSYTARVDLEITDSTMPVGGGTVTVGQPFDASISVTNIGEERLNGPYQYYLFFCPSMNSTGCTDLDSSLVGPPLAPNQTRTYTRTLSLPTNTPLGAGYIRSVLDPDDRISEARETNNDDYDAVTVVAPTAPDVRVQSSIAPVGAASVPAGSPITINYTVLNQGLPFSTDLTVQLYHCQTADSSNCSLSGPTVIVDDFAQGQSRSYSATITTVNSANYPAGTDYVRIRLDATNLLAEGTEGEANNNHYARFILTKPTQPDLYVGASTAPVGTAFVASGHEVTVNYTLTNQGRPLTAPFTVALDYCPRQTTTGCTLGTTRTLSDSFSVGQQRSYSDTFTLPNGNSTFGYVRISVDSGAVIAEEIEGNNQRYNSISIRPPDLSFSSSTATSAAGLFTPGQPISVSYRLRNSSHGGAVTNSFSVRHYYCETRNMSACTPLGVDIAITDDFASDTGGDYVDTYTLPAVATVGQRYIRTFVDSLDTVAESVEVNNNRYRAIDVTCPVGVAGASCDVCDTDYYGFPSCAYCLASTTCNDNGTCGGTGACACGAGFAGTGCEYSDALNCSGEGVAQDDGSCACAAGYAGPGCEYSDAITCSGTGTAQDDGACACETGFAGTACQYSDVTTCTGGGVAQDDGSCLCNEGFAGSACQYSDAATCNSNGVAQDDGSCECAPNTAGPACEFSDVSNCSGNGMAQDDGTCLCADSFAGEACQYSDAETCSGHGAVQGDATCVCADTYAGDACQYSDAETCNDHGTAQIDGTCGCADGYSGDACQYSDGGTCGDNGTAQPDGTCACADGYSGEACDEVPAQSCRCTQGLGQSPWTHGLALFVMALFVGGRRRRERR